MPTEPRTTTLGQHAERIRTDAGRPPRTTDLLEDPGRLGAVAALLATLEGELLPRQADVLRRVLGLGGRDAEAQSAVATELGLSRERVGAIVKQALARLLAAADARPGQAAAAAGGHDLVRYGGDATREAIHWGRLPDEALRRQAVRAANDRDLERLWGLTNAYLTLYGPRGGNVSERTRATYRRGVADLLEAWPDENLLRPGRDAGAVYLRRLETEPIAVPRRGGREEVRTRSAATVAVKLAAARALYRALRWSRATEATPFDGVSAAPDPTPPHQKRGAYEPEEVERLLAHADATDRAFILLCAHGGLRISEATSLPWRAVNWRTGEIVVRGKGGKQLAVPASDRLLEALRELYDLRRDRQEVLPYGSHRARERFRRLCLEAGVEYAGREVHGLRHTAGTTIYRINHDIAEAAEHLRHADIQTTRRYAKQDPVRRRRNVRDL